MQTLKARYRTLAILAFFPMALVTGAFGKMAPELGRRSFETSHFRIHYPPHYQLFAEALSDRLEDAYARLGGELRWVPPSKIEVVVRGDTDVPNGLAEVFPYDRLVLNGVPPEPWGFFSESDDWIRTLAIHELTHVIANDETFGFFNLLRTLIGSAAKINPYQPAWLVEGLAVYEETTKTSRGRGRAVWSDMVLRSAMLDSLVDPPTASGADLRVMLDRLNDGVRPWPEGHSAYLYGYVLNAAMAALKGTGAPARISEENGATFPFAIEKVAKDVLGTDYAGLWHETIDRLKEEYRTDLAKIENEAITNSTPFTNSGRRTRGLATTAEGRLYFIRDSASDGVGLSVIEKGVTRNLTYWKWDGGTRLRVTSDGRFLVYSRIAPYLENSLYSDVYLYDLKSEEEIQVTLGARATDPEISADFGWEVRTGRSRGELFYVKNLRDGNQAIASLETGTSTDPIEKLLYNGKNFARLGAPALGRGPWKDWLAFSEKGLSAGEHLQGVRIGSQTEIPESRAFTTALSTREIATTPDWTENGSLLYSSGSGGVFNLYRIPPNEVGGKSTRALRLTNFRTGALQPSIPWPGAPLFAMVYGSGGWNLSQVRVGEFSVAGPGVRTLEEKISSSPKPIPTEPEGPPAVPRTAEDYSVFPALWPKYWAPDARKVTDGWTLGVQTSGYDAWENHHYRLFAGHDSRAKFPIWDLNYQFDGFHPTLELSVRRENRYFATYAESNQIDTNEAHVYMPAGWDTFLILGFTNSTSRLFGETNTTGGFELGWSFDRMRVYDDSIDSTGESGVRGRAELTGYFVGPERFSSFDSRIDIRIQSPIRRHFFRLGANYAGANNEKLSALYYLGGGEETIANQSDYLLRGYPQGTIFGRRIVTSNFEYVFPVADVFRGFGTFPAFFESSRIKLFFDAGSAEYVGNDSQDFRRWPNAVGAHLLTDLNLLYRVPVTFAVGFDYGLAKDLGGERRVVLGLFSRIP
jgi:hypothetical protein